SVSTNPRIRCQACASVLTNSNIRSAPMLDLPRLQGFSITLSLKDDKIPKLKNVLEFCQQSESNPSADCFFSAILARDDMVA
ncbi:hypothetical protein MOB55_21480, partial [Bacillus haynesii]|nr:hypothetical protein [Bacillus haynesii]